MTLTPPRFHIADDMPMSLGKAIARAIAPKVDPITAFEIGDHQCRPGRRIVIKGAPSAQSQPESGQSRSETVGAPPSVQKFKVGQKVRVKTGSFIGLVGELSFIHGNDNPMCHVYADGKKHVTLLDWVELISPASETETEGWVAYKRGDEAPRDCMEYLIRWSDGEVRRYKNEELSLNDDLRSWDGNVKSIVIAYKVIA